VADFPEGPRPDGRGYEERRRNCTAKAIAICATLYALAGLSLFVDPSRRSYYLVFFSIWPVLAFLAFAEKWWMERAASRSRRGYAVDVPRKSHAVTGAATKTELVAAAVRRWTLIGRATPLPARPRNGIGIRSRRSNAVAVCMVVTGVILLCCWLPSLAWNVLRVRESVVLRGVLDREPVVKVLREKIPTRAEVWGDGEWFVMARSAGLTFTPLSIGWNDAGITAPDGAWLVLTPGFEGRLRRHNPGVLEGRRVVYEGVAFRGSRYMEEPFVIHGPRER